MGLFVTGYLLVKKRSENRAFVDPDSEVHQLLCSLHKQKVIPEIEKNER